MRGATVVSAGLGLTAACSSPAALATTPTPDMAVATAPAQQTATDYKDMDRLPEDAVKKFLDTAGKDDIAWRRPLEPKMDDDTKVFDITCKEVDWEAAPGQTVKAMTYNGLVPGPEIRVTEGDKMRVNVKNEMTPRLDRQSIEPWRR